MNQDSAPLSERDQTESVEDWLARWMRESRHYPKRVRYVDVEVEEETDGDDEWTIEISSKPSPSSSRTRIRRLLRPG